MKEEEIACLSKECMLTQRNITLPYDLRIYESNMKELPYGMIIQPYLEGVILLTAKILYDSAVFKSSMANAQSIQAYVEEPEISSHRLQSMMKQH